MCDYRSNYSPCLAGTPEPAKRPGRIDELDFLKSVFICLMIVFHLVYVSDTYPYAKQIVYTFHMPAFLVISGYVAGAGKEVRPFFRAMLWIFVPYAVMETGYTVMASLLPIREHIDSLTPGVLAEKIFVRPLGPYWYLHTLVLCTVAYWAVFRYVRASTLTRLILLALGFYALSCVRGFLSFPCAMYFLVGGGLRQSGVGFCRAVRPSALALVPFALLCLSPDNLDKTTVGGVAMVWLSMSVSLSVFRHMGRARRLFLFIGRNTLSLLLFSPIFTILAKALLPYLAFDPTGALFIIAALALSVAGSLAITVALDRLGLSPLFFGKRKALQS